MLRRTAAGAALAWLAGCEAVTGASRFPPSPDGLGLPPGSDPVLAAVLNARSALADPPRRIGPNPAFAARIVGQLELVTAMIVEPRFTSIEPIAAGPLRAGRAEARGVIGLAQPAEAQTVIRALATAAAALDRGDREAALAGLAPVSAEPAASLTRLAALPFMPGPNNALSLMERLMNRLISPDES